MTITEQLRKAIRQSGLSGYRICAMTGINKGAFSRFLTGKGGLNLDSVDKLCDALNLTLTHRKDKKK